MAPKLSSLTSNTQHVTPWLDCYQQSKSSEESLVILLDSKIQHTFEQHNYGLPLGLLRLLKITVYLPAASIQADIERTKILAIKSGIARHKRCLQQDKDKKERCYYVLTLNIQQAMNETVDTHHQAKRGSNSSINIKENTSANNKFVNNNSKLNTDLYIAHSFGARYFLEELVLDDSETEQGLQVFSDQDWQLVLATLPTPSELLQFLCYHAEQLQIAIASGRPNFESEQALLTQFMSSEWLFSQALAIDNALLNYKIQDQPNPALIAMSIAQRHHNATTKMYQQHMQQAALLWEQLSLQILETSNENFKKRDAFKRDTSTAVITQFVQWQQQLLDESLFSRHELVRMLYQYPKQPLALQQSGYVVHQHSYASLGRHYVLIFYGKALDSNNSKAIIQPNLQQIAQDVATRLPLAELHHVVVLGIDFLQEGSDTYIDIDSWIQPVAAMTQKERQLTKQLQHLNQQNKNHMPKIQNTHQTKLSRMQLNITVPARKI